MIFKIFTLPLIIALIYHPVISSDVINITQTMPSSVLAGTEFTVELTINKSNITGFAKIQQELPYGFSATAIETKYSNFTFSDQIVKFIWMSLPDENEFKLSYKITVSEKLSGSISIGGVFAYLENNGRKIVDISPANIFIENPAITAAVTSREVEGEVKGDERGTRVEEKRMSVKENEEVKTSDLTASAETTPKPKTRDPEPKTRNPKPETQNPKPETRNPKPIPTISSPAKSTVEYRIQITASFKKFSNTYLSNKYNITEKIYSETHNGMNKYTVGSFTDYRSAKKRKNHIRDIKGIQGAFITAYKNGKRITVKEALDISHQKWVK